MSMKQLRLKYLLQREEGISLAELALILPVFLSLLLGMVDLGKGFNTYFAMLNAAREGSFALMRDGTNVAGMNARIVTELERVNLTIADMQGEIVTPEKASYEPGDVVIVRLEYSYELMFGAITGLPALTLSAENTVTVFPIAASVP
jgi:Flp pilus assembly protein TadG